MSSTLWVVSKSRAACGLPGCARGIHSGDWMAWVHSLHPLVANSLRAYIRMSQHWPAIDVTASEATSNRPSERAFKRSGVSLAQGRSHTRSRLSACLPSSRSCPFLLSFFLSFFLPFLGGRSAATAKDISSAPVRVRPRPPASLLSSLPSFLPAFISRFRHSGWLASERTT